MKTVILIPYRGEPGSEREVNLQFVLDWYSPLGYPVTLGDDGGTPFNRAGSRNDAADKAGDWDVAIFADADTVADLSVIREAVELAAQTGKLIVPHDDFRRLTKHGTARLIQEGIDRWRSYSRGIIKLTAGVHIQKAMAPCGALVVSREAFEKIGRWDAGFVGWGYEDNAFLVDAERTVGYTRLPGYLWHLYHQRDQSNEEARQANRALARAHAEG